MKKWQLLYTQGRNRNWQNHLGGKFHYLLPRPLDTLEYSPFRLNPRRSSLENIYKNKNAHRLIVFNSKKKKLETTQCPFVKECAAKQWYIYIME